MRGRTLKKASSPPTLTPARQDAPFPIFVSPMSSCRWIVTLLIKGPQRTAAMHVTGGRAWEKSASWRAWGGWVVMIAFLNILQSYCERTPTLSPR